jgi:hypothetical protein
MEHSGGKIRYDRFDSSYYDDEKCDDYDKEI